MSDQHSNFLVPVFHVVRAPSAAIAKEIVAANAARLLEHSNDEAATRNVVICDATEVAVGLPTAAGDRNAPSKTPIQLGRMKIAVFLGTHGLGNAVAVLVADRQLDTPDKLAKAVQLWKRTSSSPTPVRGLDGATDDENFGRFLALNYSSPTLNLVVSDPASPAWNDYSRGA